MKTARAIIILLLTISGSVYLQSLWRAHKHLESGLTALSNNEKEKAIQEFRKGSSFYAPFNIWSERAASALALLSKKEEDVSLKEDAYFELRSSYVSSDYNNSIFDQRTYSIVSLSKPDSLASFSDNLVLKPGRGIPALMSGFLFISWILAFSLFILRGWDARLGVASGISFISWLILLNFA